MGNLKSFYNILLEQLKGKRVRLRDYGSDGVMACSHVCYDDKDNVIGWKENLPYKEWEGTVIDILGCDNSHVDIIFDKNLPIKSPNSYRMNCFNWHMMDYIEILE